MNPFIDISNDVDFKKEKIHLSDYFLLDKRQKKILKGNQDYFTESVTYNLNSFGYRTYKSLPENYILSFGCSHTFGFGLHEYERYTNLLENEIQIPVVNLGATGTGINFILLNLLKLIYSSYTTPKVIVCQFPNLERLTLPKRLKGKLCILPTKYKYRSLYKDDSVSVHSEFCYQTIVDICKREKIKLISFYVWNSVGDKNIKILDYARDFDHPGPKTNIAIKNYILNKL